MVSFSAGNASAIGSSSISSFGKADALLIERDSVFDYFLCRPVTVSEHLGISDFNRFVR